MDQNCSLSDKSTLLDLEFQYSYLSNLSVQNIFLMLILSVYDCYYIISISFASHHVNSYLAVLMRCSNLGQHLSV